MWIEFAMIVMSMLVVFILGMLVVLIFRMVVMLVFGMLVMSFAVPLRNCVYTFCRHDAFSLEVRGFDQPVKPPLKLKAVDNKEV